MAAPSWAPTAAQVAVYVPHRTLVRSALSTVQSQDTYQATFDTTTLPTAGQVALLIDDACAWVSGRVTPVNAASEPACRVVATLYAAAAVERGWPDDDSSLQRANDLEKRMDTLLGDLVAANTAANTQSGVTYPAAVLPVWSFPPADRRWDCNRYF